MLARLFVLAHPDDEVFCTPFLLEGGYQNYVVYLTSGKLPNQPSKIEEIRQREAKKSLELIHSHVSTQQIILKNASQDSALGREITDCLIQELIELITNLHIAECFTMKFEGGHQDHDIANVITRLLCMKKQVLFREFVMYSPSGWKFINYKINMDSATGEVFKFNKLKVVLLALRMMKIYSSQWRTWIGLMLPLVYCFLCSTWRDGYANPRDPFSISKVALYEIRGKETNQQVNESIQNLIKRFENL